MNSSGARTHPNLDDLSSDALGFMPWMPAARRLRRAEASVALAPPQAVAELPLSLTTIDSAEKFEAISIAASDLISNGRVAKFLVDRRDATQPVVRFVNGNFTEGGAVPESARFHYMFALAVLGTVSRWRSSTRSPTSPMTSATSPVSYTATFWMRRPSRCTACSSIRKT